MIDLIIHPDLQSIWQSPLQDAIHHLDASKALSIYVGGMQDEALQSLNKTLYRANQMLFVIVPGAKYWLGPAVIYGHTPCIGCYERNDNYFAFTNYREKPIAYYPEMALTLAGVSREYLAQFLDDEMHPLRQGYVLGLNPYTAQLNTQKRVAKHVTCRVCSKWNTNPLEVASVETHAHS